MQAMMTATASDTIEVSRTAWEMAQWEIHYLRGMLTADLVEATARDRRAKVRRQEYLANMQRALREPEFRRQGLSAGVTEARGCAT